MYIDLVSHSDLLYTWLMQVISASCSAEIHNKNNLAASIRLVNFTASLKWTNIGDLDVHRVEVYNPFRALSSP